LTNGVPILFLTEVPQQLEQLEESIKAQKFETSYNLTHKLAGGLANLSINRMHAIAKEMQHCCNNQNINQLEALFSLLKTEFTEVQQTISEFTQ
jgi:HPt (histidine-containing phosphotransfer) domain-containing protein